jgi:hypothetical protein
MPRTAYFAGKGDQVIVSALVETALLLVVGVAFCHVHLPGQTSQWPTFTWVFLPGSAAHLEPAGSWQHGTIELVLLAWIAGGLAVCTRTFRWQPR